MKAAVMREVGAPLEIETLELDAPARGEVVIKTVASGLCHSDLSVLDGKMPVPPPAVLGHEPAGIVEAIGKGVTTVKPGDHVVIGVVRYCGTCNFCTRGSLTLCTDAIAPRVNGNTRPSMLDQNGQAVAQFGASSFAEKMLIGENAITKIRPDMPLDLACLISCGVTTGLGAAMYAADLRGGDTVVVMGCGGVGLATIQGARIRGAGRIIAVDRKAEKFALAETCGATECIDASDVDAVEAVLDITNGGADIVYECIGLGITAEQAVQMTGRGGSTVLVGLAPVTDMMSVSAADITLQGKKIIGTVMGSTHGQQDTQRFIDMYMDGRLLLDELVSSRIKLDGLNDAMESMRRGEGARQVVVFD